MEELATLHARWSAANFIKERIAHSHEPEKLPKRWLRLAQFHSQELAESVWCALLYVVVEGYKELDKKDPLINRLLIDNDRIDLLKQFRNTLFHSQETSLNEELFRLLRSGQSENWTSQLNSAFKNFFERELSIKDILEANFLEHQRTDQRTIDVLKRFPAAPHRREHRYRTYTCGELDETHIGMNVRLSGWVQRIRDHGGLLFVDLRDHYGLTQLVADPGSRAFREAEKLRAESVARIDGEVRKRPAGTENPELPTGLMEVFISEIEVLGPAGELPLPVFGDQEYPEEIRLKYRFLDLRRERLHNNIMKRGKIIDSLRRRMKRRGFFEFQTPILTASSPEGARDYLVPSRIHPGKFYALPQAPQQFKQLIMVAGFDRYFQIAPCFRDEDARADRSPGEFYQLDIEMSFVTQEDVFAAVEPVLRGVFEEFSGGKTVTQKFPLIRYGDAMRFYGTDKPDLRNPIRMANVTDAFRGSGFKIFAGMIAADPAVEVWAIPAPKGGNRAFCDDINEWAKGEGQPGLGYIFWRGPEGSLDLTKEGEKLDARDVDKLAKAGRVIDAKQKLFEGAGPLAKNIGPERTKQIADQLGLGVGDGVFFVAGKPKDFVKFAGVARTKIGEELSLIAKDRFEFCWIVDFPMYEWNEEEKRIDFSHNPFSMPNYPLDAFLELDPNDQKHILEITAFQYDIVCNGVELSSGAIRNHRPDVMKKAFAIAGYGEDTLEQKFGGMLRALSLGAPPHGGIAPGVDRIVMLLCGEENLREVVLFPMNQRAEDLLMGAPSEVSQKQLRELHIRLALPQNAKPES